MTGLEKFLSGTLFIVSGAYALTVISTIKHIKRQQECAAKIKETVGDIIVVLKEKESK